MVKKSGLKPWPLGAFSYYSCVAAVLTYRISKKEVGIIINKAVAINPRIFTSIMLKNLKAGI